MNAEMAPATAKPCAAPPPRVVILAPPADEMRGHPARQADDDRSPGRRPQARDVESGNQPCGKRERNAVYDQDEQAERQDGPGHREDEDDRTNERVDDAQAQRRDDERPGAREGDAG